MEICTVSHPDKRPHTDLLILPFWKEEEGPREVVVFDKLNHLISGPINTHDFLAKESETSWLYGTEPEENRVLLLGLGEKSSITQEKFRRIFFHAIKACKGRKIKTVSLVVPKVESLSQENQLKAIIEGLFFGSYHFTALKNTSLKDEQELDIDTFYFIGSDPHATQNAFDHVQKVMKAIFFARDLTNSNADDMNPQILASKAQELTNLHPRIKTTVYDKKWLEKEGMGLILAVSRGSNTGPVFVVSKYEGNPTSNDSTVLVGKGITFDTGGLNLKSVGMETMKGDMAGAAICLGILLACAELNLPVNIQCVFAACENAIGPLAFKPGDVYESYHGATVEITNTDAEGRLILADSVAWVEENLAPSRIIDFATLTGAMEVALGGEASGFMANSDALAEELIRASNRTHERIWRFPLYDEYKEPLKSQVADLKNYATREGSAIVAASFIASFIEKTPWAHFDIAGTAFLKEAKRYMPKYATGVCIRMMVDFFEHLCKTEI